MGNNTSRSTIGWSKIVSVALCAEDNFLPHMTDQEICVSFWRTGKQAKLKAILFFSFRMNAIQEDFFSKLLIFLTVWCSCWSKVSRNEPQETDFSEVTNTSS